MPQMKMSDNFSFSEDAVPRPPPMPLGSSNGTVLAQPIVPEVSLLMDQPKSLKQAQGCMAMNLLWNRNLPGKSVTFQTDQTHSNPLPNVGYSQAKVQRELEPLNRENLAGKIPATEPSSFNQFASKADDPSVKLTQLMEKNSQNIVQASRNQIQKTDNLSNEKNRNDLYGELIAQVPTNYTGQPTLADIYSMLKNNPKTLSPSIPARQAENHTENTTNHTGEPIVNLLKQFQRSTEASLNKMRQRTVRQLNQINAISSQMQRLIDYAVTNSLPPNAMIFKDMIEESTDSSDVEELHFQNQVELQQMPSQFCSCNSDKNKVMKHQSFDDEKQVSRKKQKGKMFRPDHTLPARLADSKSANQSYRINTQKPNKTMSMCPDYCKHTPPATVNRKPTTISKPYQDCSNGNFCTDHSECSSEYDDSRHSQKHNKIHGTSSRSAKKKIGMKHMRKYGTQQQFSPNHQSKNSYSPQIDIRSDDESSDDSDSSRNESFNHNRTQTGNGTKSRSAATDYKNKQMNRNDHQLDKYSRLNMTENSNKPQSKIDNHRKKQEHHHEPDRSFYGNILGQVNEVLQNSPVANQPECNRNKKHSHVSDGGISTPQRNEQTYSNGATDRSLFLESLKQKYLETNQFIDKYIDSNHSPEFSIGTYKYMKKYTLLPPHDRNGCDGETAGQGSSSTGHILMEEATGFATTTSAFNRTTPAVARPHNINQRRISDDINCSG